ncbi:tRNA synthetase beta subunit family protein [Wolffia australiana]
MPTVGVGRDLLFQALGKTYTDEEFDELCFEFGIELDDVTTEKAIIRKEKHLEEDVELDDDDDEEVIYKIEVPANRYDLLCLEGIARSLRIFTGAEETPKYRLSNILPESMLTMHVKPETKLIRPYVVCAVLRGLKFDQARYNSFIDIQDKLHENICRKRTLVAIGTHDLDTLKGPFTYEALAPSQISFVPLKESKSFRADELMQHYKSDKKLKKFLQIIEDSPVYPVIYDVNRTVLSLPPIINGAHSAITLETKNVFIECTATDLTKAKIVLNTMVTIFSEYSERKFEVEPVKVVSVDGSTQIYPDLSDYYLEVPLSRITSQIGVKMEGDEVIKLLKKMQLDIKKSKSGDASTISVSVPPTRSDILHACDVMEDLAIAYGFNKVPETIPATRTEGKRQPLNLFSDLLRLQVAMAGYKEVLTWVLCSNEENFSMLNRKDDGKTAVIIENPRSSEFEAVRTTLMPGLLKSVKSNIDHPRPIKLFEVGDVVFLDEEADVGASNNRRLAAVYCNNNSGYEDIHGLVERVMKVIGIPAGVAGEKGHCYFLQPSHKPEFLERRQCDIIVNGQGAGTFGIVHPEVLEKFGVYPNPCSFMEIDIQRLM